MSRTTHTATHWGNYLLESDGGRIVAVHGSPEDEHPSPIGQSLLDAQSPDVRVPCPMVREGFLRHGLNSDGGGRGRERFVPVSWERALDLAADALGTIREKYGNEAVFGGAYGWASAGRFHHALSQIHRFLNQFGGFVDDRDTYSVGAGNVILPYVVGQEGMTMVFDSVDCREMLNNTQLLVCFGGIAMKNTQVNSGGVGNHSGEGELRRLRASGARFVSVSPFREDIGDFLDADWLCIRPTTDTAVMLAIAHRLYVENLYDRAFVERYTTGFDRFVPYLTGDTDGVVKDAHWAAAIAGIPAQDIVDLARDMAMSRTLVSASWSLQRTEHGEQPWWMAMVLAAMLGQIGLPGGGINYGFGSVHNVGFQGRRRIRFKVGALPLGENPVRSFIPVSRIADMLLNPGAVIDYAGMKITYPDIKAIVWAGGNPFHHHQDLNKLVRAWARPQAIIINEIFWTSSARRADIVFPVTHPVERDDIAASRNGTWIMPSQKAVEPFAESRNDYDVYTGLAERLGFGDRFTEGRSDRQWLHHLYQVTLENARANGVTLLPPDFETFWKGGPISFEEQIPPRRYPLEHLRDDPDANPLPTPSGRIEIFSETIAGYGLDDCLGHPAWFEKREWLGSELAKRFPLHLISNQPKTRLHSQLDHGVTSRNSKIQGREVVTMHPLQAEKRGIRDGDVVRIFNDRGSCLAAARLSEGLYPEVIVLPTGAWYDPVDANVPGSMDTHGNPNVLTQDVPSSRLGQGCAAHNCLVDVEPFRGELPPIKISRQPEIVETIEAE
jgi:biotin/methionine sulfoxide reductase